MSKEVFYIDNNTIFKGTTEGEKRINTFGSKKTYTKIHFPYLVDQNSGKVMGSVQQFFEIWIPSEDIFVIFSEAKDELIKRIRKTKVETVFELFKKNHYCVFFTCNQKRYKGILNKEYFFNDVDNLFYFKITDIFEIKFFNECPILPANIKSVYLPETKLYSSMSGMRKEYEENLKDSKKSTSSYKDLSSFIGLLKEERYDNNAGTY